MNLMTKRPEWLFRALGLNDPTLPQHLATDQVVPVIDIAQQGWSGATFFDLRVSLAMAGGVMIGGPAFPVLPGGLTLRADECAVVLAMGVFNGGAAAYAFQPFLSSSAPVPPAADRALLSSHIVAAGVSHTTASYSASVESIASYLPLVIPQGWALAENIGGSPLMYALIQGVRLPAGVKPL